MVGLIGKFAKASQKGLTHFLQLIANSFFAAGLSPFVAFARPFQVPTPYMTLYQTDMVAL